jgi:hypothetical protein
VGFTEHNNLVWFFFLKNSDDGWWVSQEKVLK